jgi:hypothetical protein
MLVCLFCFSGCKSLDKDVTTDSQVLAADSGNFIEVHIFNGSNGFNKIAEVRKISNGNQSIINNGIPCIERFEQTTPASQNFTCIKNGSAVMVSRALVDGAVFQGTAQVKDFNGNMISVNIQCQELNGLVCRDVVVFKAPTNMIPKIFLTIVREGPNTMLAHLVKRSPQVKDLETNMECQKTFLNVFPTVTQINCVTPKTHVQLEQGGNGTEPWRGTVQFLDGNSIRMTELDCDATNGTSQILNCRGL